MPINNGIYDVIRHNLKESCIDCTVLPQDEGHQFKYPNAFIRFLNFLSKTLFRYNLKSFIISWRRKNREKKIFRQNYDLLLAIRPDLMSLEQIEQCKQVCLRSVGYQWDGLDRFPGIYEYIDYFEHFCVFDKCDLSKNPKLKFKTNFRLKPYNEDFEFTRPDAHFIGDVDPYRYQLLLEVADHLGALGYKPIFYIIRYPAHVTKKHPSIRVCKSPISYNQNLHIVKHTQIIIDITHQNLHSGLSLRFFEAMEFKKKLITTNGDVLEYDFYHPNNIYIYGQSKNTLAEFLSLPYYELSSEITDKYKIDEWIKEFGA